MLICFEESTISNKIPNKNNRIAEITVSVDFLKKPPNTNNI